MIALHTKLKKQVPMLLSIIKNKIEHRESNKRVMTARKYSFLLADSSHKVIWELYILAKYGNFSLNIQSFEKTP